MSIKFFLVIGMISNPIIIYNNLFCYLNSKIIDNLNNDKYNSKIIDNLNNDNYINNFYKNHPNSSENIKNKNIENKFFIKKIYFFYKKLKEIFFDIFNNSNYNISLSFENNKNNNFHVKKKEKEEDEYGNSLFNDGKYYYFYSIESDFDPRSINIAVNKLVKFIEKYPNDDKTNEAHTLLKSLDYLLEKRNYHVYNSFFLMRKYKSAIFCFKDFLKNYPYSDYAEDVLYKKCISEYNLHKKKSFYNSYKEYIKKYPKSKKIIRLKKLL
ncbi:outer membrane protein assembly factor BamD [Blattabacterium cuenoti]|uniref:outer membrane protein assembly factor BamD n=1 Tax=Blattabacterium cuenoti TaxID=1653831 RepID=UPI00163B6A23|nr:outer membrane protein assembly factor BamD [Blattabacterium cuenoti]